MSRYFDYRKGVPPTPDDICFDNLLYHALVDYLEDEGRDLERIHEEEAGPMPLPVRRKANGKYMRGKLARAAVAFLLAGTVSFLTLFGTVEAFRVKVINTYYTFSEDVNKLIVNSRNNILQPGPIIYFPEYIPSGFLLTQNVVDGDIVTITYTHSSKWIIFKQQVLKNTNYHTSGTISDDFDAQINGYPAQISCIDDDVIILWYSDEALFRVRTNLSKDEAIKIAESVIIY